MDELKNMFIDAEKIGVLKVKELFNELFSKYQSDYKKVANLMLVLKDRLQENLDNDELNITYIELTSEITGWSNEKLSDKKFNEFCKLADNYSIIKVENSDN